jgi:hypothetical protein
MTSTGEVYLHLFGDATVRRKVNDVQKFHFHGTIVSPNTV